VRDFKRRKIIRRSWGNATGYPNLQLGFVVGQEPDPLYADGMMKLAMDEALHENDTLLVPYHDAFRNISCKNLAILDFFGRNCLNAGVPFLMRVDDDYPVNLGNVLSLVKSIPRSTEGMFGKVLRNDRVKRDPLSKYYTPEAILPQKVMPPFVIGEGLLMTGKLTPKLFEGLLHIEYDNRLIGDHLLALVAKKFGIKLINIPDYTAKLRTNQTGT
jgi:hypothetical protein